MVIGMTIDINDTIISNFAIMLGGIIWRYMPVSSGDYLYSHTLNPAIVIILNRKPFWTSLSSNWDIIVIGNYINSSLPSRTLHLTLVGNYITIGVVIVEYFDICLCAISINIWSIVSSIPVSDFPTISILCLILTYCTVLDHF